MKLESYARALVDQWERGIRDPEDVVRELRTALREEADIALAEAREAASSTTGNPLREAIERIQRMRDAAVREQVAGPVADVLTQKLREDAAAQEPRSAPWPDYMHFRAIAEEAVADMSDEHLSDTWEEVSWDFWETAKSEDHEWYDTSSGEIAALDRVLDVLQALARGLTPAQGGEES